MSTGHVLLGLLATGQRHGYDLKREHDARFPAARPLAFGQVYAALERLRSAGLVAPSPAVRVDGPERTPYAVTAEGRRELDRWLAQIEPPSPYVSNPVAVKVTLALLTADQASAEDYLERQRAAHMDRMREFTRLLADPGTTLAERLAADYALTHLDADLRWIEAALDRVADLSEEIKSVVINA